MLCKLAFGTFSSPLGNGGPFVLLICRAAKLIDHVLVNKAIQVARLDFLVAGCMSQKLVVQLEGLLLRANTRCRFLGRHLLDIVIVQLSEIIIILATTRVRIGEEAILPDCLFVDLFSTSILDDVVQQVLRLIIELSGLLPMQHDNGSLCCLNLRLNQLKKD